MITVLDRNRNPLAILENAISPGYTKQRNSIWSAKFTLPYNDPKRKFCEPFNYVEIKDNGKYIGLFRIIPSETTFNEQKTVFYELEHVLATLLDDVLFLYHQITNWTIREVLQYIMNKQTTKHWKLGTVSFADVHSYSWENENLLSALFSVPRALDSRYKWTWDTQSYPWTLNLVEDTTDSEGVLRYAYNMKELQIELDPSGIINRIYPLGDGDGVNQLTIKKMNGGLPYLEDKESIAKYGLKPYIWVDKRYKETFMLFLSAWAKLRTYRNPKLSIRATAADVSKITGLQRDELTEGKIITLIHPDFGTEEQRIVKEEHPDFIGKPGEVNLEIANSTDDLGSMTTDLERRQQISELYSNGATNIDSYQYNDNCDETHPAIIRFRFPDEMVNVNSCKLTYETDSFRAYERATKGGGATVVSSSAGGGTTVSSSAGGGTTVSSSAGGGTTVSSSAGGQQTSSAGGDHKHRMFSAVGFRDNSAPNTSVVLEADNGHRIMVNDGTAAGVEYYTAGSSGNHTHTVNAHTHSVTIGAHTHSVSIDPHTHSVTIEPHTHTMTLPDHKHDLEYGIYEYDKMPSKHTIKVDGVTIPITALSGDDIDIVPYLSKESGGNISRGFHTLEIKPNNLARVTAILTTQFFIRSQGEYTV